MSKLDIRERLRRRDGPMHGWFSLSYAAFLVVPRLAIQEMPVEWQERLIALLEEASPLLPDAIWNVQRRNSKGRLAPDPWRDYRHSTTEDAFAADKRLGLHKD